MAHIIKDRVRESTTTTGTTDFALAGAVTDFYGFADVMANGDTCWYAAVLSGGGGWEVGLGTFSAPSTLQRTTVLASSTGAKISFGAGTKDLFLDIPAAGLFTAAGGKLAGALNWADYVTVASAATTDIGAAASNLVNITGTTTITSLGSIAAGAMRWVKFAGALTLTNGTAIINLGGANIVTAAGDIALFVSEGSGNWRMLDYTRASGGALTESGTASLASAATVNIGAANINNIEISGSTTITAFDSFPAGIRRTVTFLGALTLTYNATSLILPGAANITTAAGDVAQFVSLGTGNWRCATYQKASGAAVVAAGGGDVTLISTASMATAAASYNFSLPTGYKSYKLVFRSVGNGGQVKTSLRFSTDGGSTFATSYAVQQQYARGASNVAYANNGLANIPLNWNANESAGLPGVAISGEILISGARETARYTNISGTIGGARDPNTGTIYWVFNDWGFAATAESHNLVQVTFASDNGNAGDIDLYGLK